MTRPIKSVTASDARRALGALLDRGRAGDEIVITRRGNSIAKVVPFFRGAAPAVEVALTTFARIRNSLRRSGTKVSRQQVGRWINR